MTGDANAEEWSLGINEAVSIPVAMSKHKVGTAQLDKMAQMVDDLGVDVVRVNASTTPRIYRMLSGKGKNRGWASADRAMQRLGRHGLSVIMVVSPWPANDPWNQVDNCRIDDIKAYASRVQQLVERYDRDGVGDVSGAARVIAWEVDNEPDLHETSRPGFCPPRMHVATVKATARAIRNAHSRAVILNGGIYRPQTENGRDYINKLAKAGILEYINGISLHLYPMKGDEAAALERAVAHTREVLGDLPIWITETSTTGVKKGRGERGEREQARAMVELVATAKSLGVRGLMWHTLVDPPKLEHSKIPSPGLFAVEKWTDKPVKHTASWRPKPSADLFMMLTSATGEITKSGSLASIKVDGGYLVWSPSCGGEGELPAGTPKSLMGSKLIERRRSWYLKGVAFVSDA